MTNVMLMEVTQGNTEDIKSGDSGGAKHVFKTILQHNIIVGLSSSEMELPLKSVIMPCSQVHVLATCFLAKLGIVWQVRSAC